MKTLHIRLCTVLLLCGLLLGGCSHSFPEYTLATGGSTAPTEKQYNDTVQLTEQDIQSMNGGEALLTYSDEGYVTTLVGKYCETPIGTYEDAVASLNGIASLIGLSAGSEFFCVYGASDNEGYTYYTFQQKYAGLTLQYATLKVVVDPQGYTAGLSCSFTPNVGIAEEKTFISASEAEAIVREKFPEPEYRYYTDFTQKSAVTFNARTVECVVVYTSNPEQSMSFDMPFIEHFVTYAGEYLTSVPTSSIGSELPDAYKTDDYFKNLAPATFTGSVTLFDGSVRQLTVPVAYNAQDGLYYLADIERKIMVADYAAFNFRNQLDFVTSAENSAWDGNYLITYYNYICAYDYYADMNIRSIDGFETPILITVNMCDSEGKPENNACFYGLNNGWACFGSSQVNRYGEALDVVAHEYTHGVTRCSMQGTLYANETGAINEAYSDIMGNLIEMREGATNDGAWLLGERCGEVMRSMSDPNAYGQPAFVGDVFYGTNVLTPARTNDNGSVHTNNSLLSHIAYGLYREGMSLAEESKLWFTSIELMTPLSDYDDIYACLIFSAKINGLNQYSEVITRLFTEAGLLGDREQRAYETTKSGCGRVEFRVSDALAQGADTVAVYTAQADGSGQYLLSVNPDRNGRVSFLAPAGTYLIVYIHATQQGNANYGYHENGWAAGTDGLAYIEVAEGRVTTLNDIS